MYVCPLCEMQYPDKVPANCKQCKRPLILEGQYRIEISMGRGPAGEDFDTTDLKTGKNVVLRELRIKKRNAAQRKDEIQRYEQNKKRLSEMEFYGEPVLIDDFEVETKNSRCFYFVFTEDAWAGLGDELYKSSGGEQAGGDDEELPELDGRDMDPELAAMLDKINKGGEGPAVSDPELAELVDDGGGGGALAKTKGDKPPAKTKGDKPPAKKAKGGAMATKTKVVIGVSLLTIIGAVLAAVFLIL